MTRVMTLVITTLVKQAVLTLCSRSNSVCWLSFHLLYTSITEPEGGSPAQAIVVVSSTVRLSRPSGRLSLAWSEGGWSGEPSGSRAGLSHHSTLEGTAAKVICNLWTGHVRKQEAALVSVSVNQHYGRGSHPSRVTYATYKSKPISFPDCGVSMQPVT